MVSVLAGKLDLKLSGLRTVLQLAAVCERMRSEDNLAKIDEEIRSGGVAARKAVASWTDADRKLDPKLAASLETMFGVSAGVPPPITDIIAVFKGDPIPDGYSKV